MATAASWSDVDEETTNFARVCKLLFDVGAEVLRGIFDSIHPPSSLSSHLKDPQNHSILKKLHWKKVLFKEQWSKLYPTGGSTADSRSFDIGLLFVLLRSICNLTTPTAGNWNDIPAPTSTKIEDDILRIKQYRNRIAHIEKARLTVADFNQYWEDIANTLLRLGGKQCQAKIDKLKSVSIDPEGRKRYKKLLKEAIKTSEKLAKMDGKLNDILSKLQVQITGPAAIVHASVEGAELYSQNLKKNIRSKVEKLNEIPFLIEGVKLDDIYNQLVMYDRPREKSDFSHESHRPSCRPGSETALQIDNIEDIFQHSEGQPKPKSILIEGQPGVGKSLFCRKFLHDWSQDSIFKPIESADNPLIKFAYLLPFRQINMISEKEFNLRELLNHFQMLQSDDKTMINDSVMEYIIQHPENLVILLDGFDEYEERQNITSDSHIRYRNDPMCTMPVTAMVSKLLLRKVMSNSVLIVTSRPGETHKIKNRYFDRCVDMPGYSKEQVIEFIRRFFNTNQQMQAQAVAQIKANQHYLGLAHVPLMAVLICVYIKFNFLEYKQCFPEKITDFYTEVVKCIEKNYNKAIQNAKLDKETIKSVVDEVMDRMANLAAKPLVDGRYTFTDQELKELNLSELELTYLKGSSLLFCESSSMRKTAFDFEDFCEYCFNHTTFQEYFAARYFASKKLIPDITNLSEITLQFMAGQMNAEDDEQIMEQLLQNIEMMKGLVNDVKKRILVTCLYEYSDENLAKKLVQENKLGFWESNGRITFRKIDYKVISWFIDIISRVNQQQESLLSPAPYKLCVSDSPLTHLSTELLFKSLASLSCTITALCLNWCKVDDTCCECIRKYLADSKLTDLDLCGNYITDQGAKYLLEGDRQLMISDLNLQHNKIANKSHVRHLFEEKHHGHRHLLIV